MMTLVAGVIALVLIFVVVRNPQFKTWLTGLTQIPTGTTPPPTDGTTPPPADGQEPTVQGDTPYPGSNPTEMEDQGQGTRHYASGKPDDVTHEWEATTSAQSYMIVIDITLTETDHDDTISFKYGGTHNGSGWYDNGYSFEAGQACIGKEENHPSTDLCEVTGTSIGNLVNTPVKLAAINFNKGEKLEMWSNLGSGWTKDVETGPGVTGFRPSESEDECMIRIDAAPGITMRSAQVFELTSTTPSTGGTTQQPAAEEEEEEEEEEDANVARVLTARKARKRMYYSMYSKGYRSKEEGNVIPITPIGAEEIKRIKIGGIS